MAVNPESGEAEFELVVQCARTALEPAGAERVAALLRGPLRWNHVAGLASYHDVVPHLYSHLKAQPEGLVPPEVVASFRQRSAVLAARGLALVQELGRLAALFEAHELPVLAVKGPTLAETIYGGIALRPFVDLDLLVRRPDFGRLEALLREEGYRQRALTPFQKAGYLLIHAQTTFWRPAPGGALHALDVHTAMLPMGYSYSERFEDLWERAPVLSIGGGSVPTLGPEDLLHVLCYHGFKNRWDRLKYFVDVAELVRAHPGMDWSVVRARARAMRSRRVMLLGLLLAHEVLGAPVPEALLREARSVRSVVRLSREVEARLPEEAHLEVEPYWARVRLNLLAQDSLLGRLRYSGYALLRRLSDFVLPVEGA